ncbi:MAG TPA: myxococcus cysteine-rich repeat containing protein [Candidatus Binatia bacterium]|nr:myxococcus cysteine-rich repeat containing protein [Candidatus Binatia bacterium]
MAVGWTIALTAARGEAQTVQPPFAASYSMVSLGTAPGVQPYYGGLTIKFDDPDTLLLGGGANSAVGKLYAVPLVRDQSGHITGFAGTAAAYAPAPGIDGGLVYGPSNVLFVSRYPQNDMGELKPGSAVTDKVVDLDASGVASTVGTLGFVPPGFPGAGRLKAVSWTTGGWYDVPLTPDASGTFDAGTAILRTTMSGGVEGVAYVPAGSPQFPNPTVLVSEYSNGSIAVYDVDANGDPASGTRRPFITGLIGAEGATIDPVTGDFLFSTFGSQARVIAVRGFAHAVCGDGTVDAGEECDDGNTTDGDCCSSTCTRELVDPACLLDDFLCYKATPAKAAAGQPAYPAFTPKLGAVVVDPFSSADPTDRHELDLSKTIGVCNPADRDGTSADAPAHAGHLAAYQAKMSKTDPSQPGFVKQVKTFSNPLGTLKLSLTGVDRFLEPSGQAPGDGGAPALGDDSLDRFKCYKAKVAKAPSGQPPYPLFTAVQVSVTDAFGGPSLFALQKPTRVCAPADRDGLDPEAPTHVAHLVCYKASLAKTDPKQPKFARLRISTANALAHEVLDAKSVLEVCVPSKALD